MICFCVLSLMVIVLGFFRETEPVREYTAMWVGDLLQELVHVVMETQSPMICHLKLENQESSWYNSVLSPKIQGPREPMV